MSSESAQANVQVPRIWEQPEDAIAFYSEIAQVINTGHEIILQFYESIPGPPDASGKVTSVRARLRATVTVGQVHARNIGDLLLKNLPQQGDQVAKS